METVPSLKRRPKHLDLLKIRLPVPGIVSILHRVSGMVMFLLIPLVLYLFQGLLGDAQSHAAVSALVSGRFAKLVLIGLLWALLHHLLAGLRFLALDLHKGLDLPVTRLLSKLVLAASVGLTVVIGAWLW